MNLTMAKRRKNPWRDHKIGIAAGVVALLIVVAVVADKNDVYPCKGRKRTHKGQTYRVRTCFRIKEATPKIHGASPVQHKIEFLVDGRWVDTVEFWNVSAAGAWES